MQSRTGVVADWLQLQGFSAAVLLTFIFVYFTCAYFTGASGNSDTSSSHETAEWLQIRVRGGS
jgi:hypothetical protein